MKVCVKVCVSQEGLCVLDGMRRPHAAEAGGERGSEVGGGEGLAALKRRRKRPAVTGKPSCQPRRITILPEFLSSRNDKHPPIAGGTPPT